MSTARHSIRDYYIVGGINSIAATLFMYCSFFWARGTFAYSDDWNMRMATLQGLASILAAHFGGILGDRLGFDRVIQRALPTVCALLTAGLLLDWKLTPMLLTPAYALTMVMTWPCVEAAILHAPSGRSMPFRLGLYNVVWGSMSAVGFLASGWLYRWRPDSILWVPILLHLIAWAWLHRGAPDRPVAHAASAMQVHHAGAAIPVAVKARFLWLALIGNATAYLMLNGFLALAPHVGERLQLDAAKAIWLTCLLLGGRMVAFSVFWRWEGWHYRTSWALAGLWVAPLSLAGIFFFDQTILIAALLILFGLAIGLTYYGSIYYSLEFGEEKGQGGGRHEAVLGIGILSGPLVGAAGSYFTGSVTGGKWAILGLATALTTGLTLWILRQSRRAV